MAQSSVVWSANAMACVQAGAPIVPNLYDALSGAVRFRVNQVGNIALICSIDHSTGQSGLRSLRLTYRDGDGSLGPSEVRAVVRRIRRTTGAVTTLANSEVRSNAPNAPNSGPTGWATHTSGSPGNVMNHLMDLVNYYYYVQINLERTDPGVPLSVMGVHLID
jgi:hypothetical protein